jgi:hypothetical protein
MGNMPQDATTTSTDYSMTVEENCKSSAQLELGKHGTSSNQETGGDENQEICSVFKKLYK